MLISEFSRLSQLNESQIMTLATTCGKAGVYFKTITREISEAVSNYDTVEAVKAASWYFEAHNYAGELANKYNTTVDIAAGVISAVSPRMAWLRNKRIADIILSELGNHAGDSALDMAKSLRVGLYSNVALAIRIARGEDISAVLSGTKRRSFYNNIVSPFNGDSVTVDTWMIESLVRSSQMSKSDAEKFTVANRKSLNGTGVGYYLISECVRNVADKMNLLPHQVQAIYWCSLASFNGGRADIQ